MDFDKLLTTECYLIKKQNVDYDFDTENLKVLELAKKYLELESSKEK